MNALPDRFKEQAYTHLRRYWGYTSFRPLQEEAIRSILEGQDSMTVLPTGGGKSLCFQLPALLKGGMAMVISPLISLMKDQVDRLQNMGIQATYLNSSLSPEAQRSVVTQIQEGQIKVLYLSPERLQRDAMIDLLKSTLLSFFAVDEAHCVSQWGHDFRKDYRNLRVIKEKFSAIGVHAFTATATKEVQRDILDQLRLVNPKIHTGCIDRHNLTYRAMPRSNIMKQITDVIEKHTNEPGIIYCFRRKDVDRVSERLTSLGIRNLPYHAGLSDEVRQLHQSRFTCEEVDIMVATVAFGMGIDRSNIRYVIHAAMPKSIEHYYQEVGRAGRDGLPSYGYVFYGGNDYRTWRLLLDQSSYQHEMIQKLNSIYQFCTQPQCRHRVLTNYFGQSYEKVSCDACDYCLGEVDKVENPLVIGQKILSCVIRVMYGKNRGFGAEHIASILKGKQTDKVTQRGHHRLSTFGIMADEAMVFIRYMIEQLVGQGFLQRDPEFSILSVTVSGRQVLKGEKTPSLAKPVMAAKKREIDKARKEKREQVWTGVDVPLFQLLREKRKELAAQKGVPAYIIFGDASLKDMAVMKPVTREAFSNVFGVGERKLEDYADIFIGCIQSFLGEVHRKREEAPVVP
jgi:ATP-dependent DNA helicase RecQ